MLSNWDIASSIAMPNQAGSSAQRIRWGLTGLAFAFLIVLMGSVVTHAGRDDAVNAANTSANQSSEPLAELGAAPGSPEATNNITTNAK